MNLFFTQLDKKNNPAGDDAKYPNLDNQDKQKKQQKDFLNHNYLPKRKQQPSHMRGSLILDNKDQQEGWCSKLCACTKLSYYKDYFKVTTKDVLKRITTALQFWKGDFFVPTQQQYDIYGPFWIHTTIVFCISAVHNILRYQALSSFDFNFQIIGMAFILCYSLGFVFPIILTFILKCTIGQYQHIQIICLYGYATSIYGLAIILCSFNVCLLHWLLLGYACFSKTCSILKNIFNGLSLEGNKKVMISGLIIIESILQFLFIKFGFIYCISSQGTLPKSGHLDSSIWRYRSWD